MYATTPPQGGVGGDWCHSGVLCSGCVRRISCRKRGPRLRPRMINFVLIALLGTAARGNSRASRFAVAFSITLWHRALAQTVVTLAGGGSSGNKTGSTDGVGTTALFSGTNDVAVHPSGNVYVIDAGNHKVRLIYPNQTVVTVAGGGSTGNISGSADGVGTAALFDFPYGIAIGLAGNLFVTDANSKIRRIFPNSTVVTLAGGGSSGNVSGSTNGVGTAALFNLPRGVAVNTTTGGVYVVDRGNRKIRLIYPNSTVITLAGGGSNGFIPGTTDGVGTNALFDVPSGIAMANGNLYIADSSNFKIRIIYPNRTVVTAAGGGSDGNTFGVNDGVGTNALFSYFVGITIAASGEVFVADRDTNRVRRISPNMTVSSFAGGGNVTAAGSSESGVADGVGTNARFDWPHGIAVDSLNTLFIGDFRNNKVRIIYPFWCSPGTFADFSSRTCILCPPGYVSNMQSATVCTPCSAGTFTSTDTTCQPCPAGHYCPTNTSSWSRLNCGRGNFCPTGSGAPTPCPFQVPPSGGWGALQVQGPAFLVETARCLNQCSWNATSSGGVFSTC